MRRLAPLRRLAVRVPGSTSNLGPGFDVLGMAVDRALCLEWHPDEGPLRVERKGTLAGLRLPPDDDLVIQALCRGIALWAQGEAGGDPVTPDRLGGRLEVDSRIPLARGLGSSAAARVAGLALGARLGADTLPGAGLLREAARAEGHTDNAAPAVCGGLVSSGWSDGGPDGDAQVRVSRLPLSPAVGWAYAAPGAVVRTDEARAALPDTVPHTLVGATAARLTVLLHGLATADGEAIAWGLRDEVHSPWRLPLVPGGSSAIAAAAEAGAWGATLSGSGSGVVALGPLPVMGAVRDAMAAAFQGRGDDRDAHAFVFRPDPRGVRSDSDDG